MKIFDLEALGKDWKKGRISVRLELQAFIGLGFQLFLQIHGK
jgi:hypothetical protein